MRVSTAMSPAYVHGIHGFVLLFILLPFGGAASAPTAVAAARQRATAAGPKPTITTERLPRNQSIPFWPEKKRITVCVSEYTPMVYCEDREPDAYTGYEVELFRRTATVLGWEPGVIEWRCISNWDELISHLKNDDGVCDLAATGMTVDPASISAGIVFSRPTYRSGLSILVRNVQKVNSTWAFWDAFDWVLWLVTLASCVAAAAIVWAIDNLYHRYSINRFSRNPLESSEPSAAEKEGFVNRDYHFERYFWESLTRAMMTRDYISFTNAGNLIQTAWGFALLILFTLYIGNTSANLTTLTLSTGGITGVDSLAGQAVGTATEYVKKLAARGIAAVGLVWETIEDEEAMVEKLKSGAIKALVLDTPFVQIRAAIDCEVSAVGEPFNIFDTAVAFPANFSNAALLQKYNEALIALEDSRTFEELEKSYVTPAVSQCEELSTTAVTFQQVSGLWVLLGLSVAAAVAWLLIVKMFEHRVAARKRAHSKAVL